MPTLCKIFKKLCVCVRVSISKEKLLLRRAPILLKLPKCLLTSHLLGKLAMSGYLVQYNICK